MSEIYRSYREKYTANNGQIYKIIKQKITPLKVCLFLLNPKTIRPGEKPWSSG
jgi:hypothetical protein